MEKKKHIILSLLTLAVLLVAPGKSVAQTFAYGGDIDDDGMYSTADLARLVDILKSTTIKYSVAADANLDGEITIDDVAKLREYIFADIVPGSIGKTKRADGTYVDWVQLWAEGPRWAVCNVGAESATDYGCYYNWGVSSAQTADNASDYCQLSTDIQGTDYDTARKLWGEYWQMPNFDDLGRLVSSAYTDSEWTSNYNGTGKAGRVFRGKGKYAGNSIFFPASGYCLESSSCSTGSLAYVWTSSPNGNSEAYCMCMSDNGEKLIRSGVRNLGLPVRAIVCEVEGLIVHPGEEANEDVGAGVKESFEN